MYLFTRRGQFLPGQIQETLNLAKSITQKVSDVTGLQTGLYTSFASPQVNQLIWAANVDTLTRLEDAENKLLGDEAYTDQVDRLSAYLTPMGLTDSLSTYVQGNIDPAGRISHVSTVQSTIQPGFLQQGLEIGIQIAERVTKLSGVECALLSDTTGVYGGVRWITAHDSMQSLQNTEDKLNNSQDFIKFIDENAAGLFSPDSVRIARRLL